METIVYISQLLELIYLMVIKVKGARFQTFFFKLLGVQCAWQDINMPNKPSSTKRFRTDTGISFNSLQKKVCVAGYTGHTAFEIMELRCHQL